MEHHSGPTQPRPSEPLEFIRGVLRSLGSTLGKTLRSRSTWRLAASLTVLQILVFFLLGIGFFIAVLGLALATLHLAPIVKPANRLLTALSRNPAGQPVLPSLHGWNWTVCFFILPAGLYLVLAAFGVRIVVTHGFLAQNMLYSMFAR